MDKSIKGISDVESAGANMTHGQRELINKARDLTKENLDLKEQIYDLEASVKDQVYGNKKLTAEIVDLKRQIRSQKISLDTASTLMARS